MLTKRKIAASLSLIFIGVFAWAQAKICIFAPLLPDEVVNVRVLTKIASVIENNGFFFTTYREGNYFGYGGFFWHVYGLFSWATIKFWEPGYSARILTLILLIAISLLIWWRSLASKSTGEMLGVNLLWLSLPMTWYCGRLIGPDFIGLCVALLGVMILLSFNVARPLPWMWAGLLFGLSFGVRATVAPLIGFAFLISAPRGWKAASRANFFLNLSYFSLCCLLGFILATPSMLRDWSDFQARTVAPVSGWIRWDALNELFSNQTWQWDIVYNGGIFDWGISLWASAFWAACLIRGKTPINAWAAIAVALLMVFYFYTKAFSFYGWYVFPFICVLFFMVGEKRRADKSTAVLLFGAVIVNIFSHYAQIREARQLKWQHYENLQEADTVMQCLGQEIATFCPLQFIGPYVEIAYEASKPLCLEPESKHSEQSAARLPSPPKYALFAYGNRVHKVLSTESQASARKLQDIYPDVGWQLTKEFACGSVKAQLFANVSIANGSKNEN